MKKLLLLIICLLPFKVFALADSAKSNILIDYNTGSIITENNSDEELPMASMTKMMTLLIIMERIDSSKIKLTDMVPISENAASMGGSQIYLEAGTRMSLDTLLRAICIASANDATVAVAEYIAGSTGEFVKLMNEKAVSLGLKHTNFKNVHGLDDEGHYSSAHDMAFIARELLRHELILEYSSIYEDYIKHPDGTNTWIVNTNKLINYYEGLDGLKTGFTKNSGYCITATAKRGNMRLISVVMGEENNSIRNQDTMELLNYGFANYKMETIIPSKNNIGSISIGFGKKDKVDLKLMTNVEDLVNINEENDYTYEIIKEEIKAPVYVGDIVGKLIVYANDSKINEYDLTVKESVLKANIFDLYIKNLKRFLKGYN
ncbi:MAG: D-alanyl-D-alanine carboxypeptidase [Bacilli bacterium]|nr:D-alanyl-D-alanine carboxypeptidase [Bacilli bacterium]